MRSRLLEPTLVGSMELRNRIVMSPMQTNTATEDGSPTKRMIDYYVERAKGGVGLIIFQHTCVDPPTGRLRFQPCIHEDWLIPKYKELVEAVKSHGAKIAMQLSHAGRMAKSSFTGVRPVAPSAIPYPYPGYEVPRELTVNEIDELVEKFVGGARRAKEAGFDAIEFHGAHFYLISQFLSPWSNRRMDEYGGNFENRLRFPLKILERTREKVGDNYPILFRINGDEWIFGGLSQEDMKKIAKRLEEATVNVIHVSIPHTPGWSFEILARRWAVTIQPMYIPRGSFAYLAEGIKKIVSIPVIAGSTRIDVETGEKIIEGGQADLVSMGRALLADPYLPNELAEGRLSDIRPCIACLHGCSTNIWADLPISCAVNPACNHEEEYKIKPAKRLKKVLVIGGGPAGMEAAIIARCRGHEVILYEKEDKLGGQLRLASEVPGKEEMQVLIKYFENQISKLGVKIVTGQEVTEETVEKISPDVAIIATGSKPLIPKIPGIDGENVTTAWAVLGGRRETGHKVVIVGGGLVGAETALYLAQRNKKVTIVEMLENLAPDEMHYTRFVLQAMLREKCVDVLTKTIVDEICEEGVIVSTKWFTRKEFIRADTVVIAVGSVLNKELTEKLKNRVPEIYMIGDCVKPRRILEAVHEGFKTAIRI